MRIDKMLVITWDTKQLHLKEEKNSQGDTILSHPTMPPPHIPSMGLKLDTYCI